jgi:hypothetical protein
MIQGQRFTVRGAGADFGAQIGGLGVIPTGDDQVNLRFAYQRPDDARTELPITTKDNDAEGHGGNSARR